MSGMTREEAIINLKLSQNRIGGLKKEEWNALQMAIEALSDDFVKVVRCKDCKYFELDHFDRIDDMPIITAHEICTKWSGGSKTSKDGFCFMGERRE